VFIASICAMGKKMNLGVGGGRAINLGKSHLLSHAPGAPAQIAVCRIFFSQANKLDVR
jgi:hypothetical protein